MKEFTIGKNEAGQRFDKYLTKLLPNATKSFIYKMLRKKNITLNGKKAAGSEILSLSDVVRLFFSDETYAKFSGAIPKLPRWCVWRTIWASKQSLPALVIRMTPKNTAGKLMILTGWTSRALFPLQERKR